MTRSGAALAQGSVSELDQEIAALLTMDRAELRALWRKRYGQKVELRSEDFLRRQLAWRLQAEAFGGLDQETLDALSLKITPERGPKLGIGTRLAREWKGERVEVEVIQGGFRHDGAVYASLSEVARLVTGVRWNGPRFFGLRGEQPDGR